MNAHWFDFLSQGHKAQNNPNEAQLFSIGGSDFELTFSNGWFTLYRLIEPKDWEIKLGVSGSKSMFGSDFYTLGRKCIHDMADDGVKQLINNRFGKEAIQ